MRIALDLQTNLALHVSEHHRFAVTVLDGETVLEKTQGADTYAYPAMLLPDQPVTATGRRYRHEPEVDRTGLMGLPGKMVDISRPLERKLYGLSLLLDNNMILSQGQLQSFYSLRVRVEDADILVPLSAPFMRVSWEGQGLFRIDLAPVSGLL